MHSRLPTLLFLVAALAGCGGGDGGSSTESSSSAGTAALGASTLGAFSAGPDLNSPRGQHTATLLQDGRVLVTGGTDGRGLVADPEVFDPLTNTWELVRRLHTDPNAGLMMDPTGSFPTARQLHTATLLTDGRVLVAGGVGIERLDAGGAPILETLRTAYVFDPTTNAFERTGDLGVPRAWHTAASLGAGAVLAGGLDQGLTSLTTAEVYDPEAGTFRTVAMGSAHTWAAMVELGGEALLLGGADVQQAAGGGWVIGDLPAARVEVVSQQGVFRAGQANVGDRANVAAVAVPEGAFFAGGQSVVDGVLTAVATTERYAGGAFRAGPSLTTARFGAQAARLGDTRDVLVLGGVDAQGQPLRSAELYDAASERFLGSVDMSIPRSDFRAVTLRDGRVLVIGGLDGQTPALGIAQTEFHAR
jgi:hypothetical protein